MLPKQSMRFTVLRSKAVSRWICDKQNQPPLVNYCWFSVSCHSKQTEIKIKTVQQIKSGIWEMKGRKYTKFLAKIQARRIFRIRDIRRNVLPKFIAICMESPCWCPPGWAPTWRTKTNKNICYRVLVQKSVFIPRGTHKH